MRGPTVVDLNPLHAVEHAASAVGHAAEDVYHAAGSFSLADETGKAVKSVADSADYTAHKAGLGGVVSGAGHIVNDGLAALNDGLLTVQNAYRIEHEVWTRHGVAGFLAAQGLMIPGAFHEEWDPLINEAARRVTGADPHNFSSLTAVNPNYRDIHGNLGTPGYDIVNGLHHLAGLLPDVGSGDYTPAGYHRDSGTLVADPGGGIDWETGIANGIFDIAFDPTLKLGNIVKAKRAAGVIIGAKKVEIATDEADRAAQLRDLDRSGVPYQFTADGKHAIVGGRVLVSGRMVKPLVSPTGAKASNIAYLAKNDPGVRDAFDRISKMDTAQILESYPQLQTSIARDLGNAHSIDDVAKVFHDGIDRVNYGYLQHGLPVTSLTRRTLARVGLDTPTAAAVGSRIADASANAGFNNGLLDATAGAVLRTPHRLFSYRPFAVNTKELTISGKEFDPNDAHSVRAVRSTLLMSQSRKQANRITADYINAPDLGTRINILSHAFGDAMRAMGLPDDSPLWEKFAGHMNFLLGNGTRQVYGIGRDGERLFLKDPETGEPLNLGIWGNQTGKIAMPNFTEVRKAIADWKKVEAIEDRELKFVPDRLRGGLSSNVVRFDDWLHDKYTSSFFKPLVLTSLGFAQRVAAAELAPAILSHSAREVVGSGLMAHAARLNPTIRDITDELGPDVLIGKKARVDAETSAGLLVNRTGKIVEVDPEARTFKIEHADTESTHGTTTRTYRFADTTLLHDRPSDEQILRFARRIGVNVVPRQLPHIRAALGTGLFNMGRALVDPDYYEHTLYNVVTHDGDGVAAAVSSNHDVLRPGRGPSKDLEEALRQAHARVPDKPQHLTDEFQFYDSGMDSHPVFWNHAIHEAARDEGGQVGAKAYMLALRASGSERKARKAYIEATVKWLREAKTDYAERVREDMALNGQGSYAYAGIRSKAFEGLTFGRNGEINDDVLRAIAGEGDVPSIAELAERPMQMRPIAVKGRVMEAIPDPNWIERLSEGAWRTMIHPIINNLSRTPIYNMLGTEEYKFLKPWVDAGLMNTDEAHMLANVRAVHRMLPLIHNTKLRSQFADLARNVWPFYFAQEQAYKRYARVIFKDPAAFRKALLGYHALVGSGALREDSEGNEGLVMPGSTFFGNLLLKAATGIAPSHVLPGIPSVISGNTISLRTVVPEGTLPSASPLVAVSLKAIQNFFPKSEPYIAPIIGPINESMSATDMLIPNATIRRALQASPWGDRSAAFQTSWGWALINAFHQAATLRERAMATKSTAERAKLMAEADSIMPGPSADPQQRQAAIDRIRNSTRILMGVKAMFGFVSPLAPVMQVGDIKLRGELQDLMTKQGVGQGIATFMERHPDAAVDTVFLSDNSSTGTAPPATQAALDWIRKNRNWVEGNKLAAAYLLPQTKGAYDVEAYNQELATHLRAKKVIGDGDARPGTLIAALYSAATDQDYYASLTDYENQRKALDGDPYAQSQLDEQWVEYKNQLAEANPIWKANSGDDPYKVQVAQSSLTQLRAALNAKGTPASPQTPLARELVASWDDYTRQVNEIRSGQTFGTSLTDLKDQFNVYLDQYVNQHPDASALVTGIFRRLVNAP